MKFMQFNDIFQENQNGSLTPQVTVRIGPSIVGPSVTFGEGVTFGGVDVFRLRGRTIVVDDTGGIVEIKGYK